MDIAEDDGALTGAIQNILIAGGIDDPIAESERIVSETREMELDPMGVKERAVSMARARASGIPLGYVLGRQRFMGIEIAVGPGVLIPRSETELLGWEAVARLREARGAHGLGARVIDMCCGSGNLACGIAHAIPGAEVWASDLMEDCATLTLRNAQRLGLSDRIHVASGIDPTAGLGLDRCPEHRKQPGQDLKPRSLDLHHRRRHVDTLLAEAAQGLHAACGAHLGE